MAYLMQDIRGYIDQTVFSKFVSFHVKILSSTFCSLNETDCIKVSNSCVSVSNANYTQFESILT